MNHIREVLPDYIFKIGFNLKQFQITVFMILFMSIVSIPKASATEVTPKAIDAKKIWNKSCFTCHGDSGDMARNFLKVVDGNLEGPLHKSTFRMFLTNHYLSKTKADAVYTMLLKQATAKSRFELECGSCHQTASDLVREKLALHQGILYNRSSKKPTYTFLESHRELNKEDVKFFMRKLTFIGYEIYQPIKLE